MLNLLLGDYLDAEDVAAGYVLQAPEDDGGVREPRRPRTPVLPEVAAALEMPGSGTWALYDHENQSWPSRVMGNQ